MYLWIYVLRMLISYLSQYLLNRETVEKLVVSRKIEKVREIG